MNKNNTQNNKQKNTRVKTGQILSRFDAVIVGSGIAGLMAALELDRSGLKVAIVCKEKLFDSNTSKAQGGIAICSGANPQDSFEQHLGDTLSAGAGLSDRRIAELMVRSGPELFEKLESYGLRFDRQGESLGLAREGGHGQARVVHSKDATGKSITEILVAALRLSKRLVVFENMFAVELLLSSGRCVGVQVLQEGYLQEIISPCTVLATGGLGQVFSRTTNPLIANGDGIAMAYRAGAQLLDMEFVQFHPTALAIPGAPAALISEAVRGAGAVLLDGRGERFAFRFHKDGELATRDLVSRAIAAVMKEEGSQSVMLDLRPIGKHKIEKLFPNILDSCARFGIDALRQAIPVSPAAHYFMGGIWSSESGQTSIPGLYAIGECACTGFHGANRLASNSLLEGGVMALAAAREIAGAAPARLPAGIKLETPKLKASVSVFFPGKTNTEFLRRRMFALAGLCREAESLTAMQKLFCERAANKRTVKLDRDSVEAANMELLSELIVNSAAMRKESRGAHFRSDFPAPDPGYLGHFFLSKEEVRFVEVVNGASLKESFKLTEAVRSAKN